MVAALYRRYRPETFSEMIGQSQVTEPLMTALRTGRVGHAYLFSGPRGCGKTTSARILARCLNCKQGPTDTPCGECESCVELSRDGGGSLDVVEIDAASHGGVDDARDLRERAVFAPARDRFKIFIIDEAHMVTAGGFNALLKIVEEPPPHVKFIFATTEPEKVIGTIRSRTHHYPFRLIAPGALVDYVQQLCDSEGVRVEPGVLQLVVRAGGGSVRDTLSILDQLIAGSEGEGVTLSRAAGLLGFTSSEMLDEVVVALGSRDAAAAFTAADRVIQTGQDPRRFVEDLLERLRDLIVVSATSVDGASAVFRGVPQDQLERMFEQARAFGRGELSRIADIVSSALDSMTGATAPRLQLELMVARALVAVSPAASADTQAAGRSEPASPAPGQQAPAPTRSAPARPAPTPDPQPAEAQVADASVGEAPHASAGEDPNAAASEAPNAAQTAASIRDFLRETDAHPNTGAASFGRPISDVLSTEQIAGMGGEAAFQAPVDEMESSASVAGSEVPDPSAGAAQPADPAGPGAVEAEAGETGADASESTGLDDLLELWPELLEEIRESDQQAAAAVQAITPLSLEGEVLTVGIATKSDLDAFKAGGAGPLREAILAATGITVKYVPRQLSAAPRAASTPGAQQGEPEASEEPHRGSEQTSTVELAGGTGDGAAEPHRGSDDAVARAEAKLSGFGPALAAPAWADEETEESESDAPEAEAAAPETEAEASDPEPTPDPDPEPAEPVGSAPSFTRYGEAVVREVLGARFIEERPLPPKE